MGLDMYMYKYPQHKGTTPKQVNIIESYIDWINNDKKTFEGKECSFKDWCGHDENEVNLECVDFYKSKITTKYSAWDIEKKWPRESFQEQVAYWRKANETHNWFVENVQGGVDDCGAYEVTKTQLELLLTTAKEVYESIELVDDKEVTYQEIKNGEIVEKTRMSKRVKDASTCERLLPTCEGFFFGSYEYDEWYVEDIKETIQNIEKVLKETDFENEVVYYCSSW